MSPGAVRRRSLLQLAAAGSLTGWSSARAQARLPIFDAHVHYSHDAVEAVPVKQAVQILRNAGLSGVFVSSSDDEGTQKLLAEAPDLIVPELRPYRTRADVSGWVREPDIVRYLEQRLASDGSANPQLALYLFDAQLFFFFHELLDVSQVRLS